MLIFIFFGEYLLMRVSFVNIFVKLLYISKYSWYSHINFKLYYLIPIAGIHFSSGFQPSINAQTGNYRVRHRIFYNPTAILKIINWFFSISIFQ